MTQWQDNPYTPLLILAGALSLVVVGAALRWRDVPGARPLALVSLGTAIWSFGYAMELGATVRWLAILWAGVQYIGIVLVPVSWLVFAARYTQRDGWLTPRRLALLCLLPICTLAAVWTNSLHGLFWSSLELVPQGSLRLLAVRYGPLFWIHTSYSYICLFGGSLYLLRMIIALPFTYRSRIGALLLALAAPWVSNMLYLFKLSPFGALDLTPLAFAISNLALTWSIVRLRLFNLIPIARGIVLEQMSDAVAVLDAQNQVVDLNTAALRALELERRQAIASPAREVFSRWPELIDRYRQTIRVDDELQIRAPTGERWYNVRISPLFDDGNELRGRLIVWRDITDDKQTMAELVAAKEAAEAASRAKSAFLANMSHELRTPLSAVLGYAQLMRLDLDRGSYERLPAYLGSLDVAGQHLLSLISNLLQITSIEANRLDLKLESFAVADLVDEVVALMRPLIDRNENLLRVECGPDLGAMTSDKAKLRQILTNLLDNAAKFTERGTIVLAAHGAPDEAGDWIHFTVSDTGVGITPEELPLLFQVFTEPNQEKRRRYGGTGIGLALARHLSLKLGGAISVGNPSSAGTTFTVRLPAVYRPAAHHGAHNGGNDEDNSTGGGRPAEPRDDRHLSEQRGL